MKNNILKQIFAYNASHRGKACQNCAQYTMSCRGIENWCAFYKKMLSPDFYCKNWIKT